MSEISMLAKDLIKKILVPADKRISLKAMF